MLDQILNSVSSLGLGNQLGGMLGGNARGGSGAILSILMRMLASGKLGGFSGMLDKFNNNGMQNQLASWVSTRPNEPVSATQVEQALGPDTVDEIAREAGVDRTQASQELTQVLPQLIDKMTPTGVMPQQDVISSVFSKLGH